MDVYRSRKGRGNGVNTIKLSHPASHLKKGEEVGFFNFGSTVVLLFEKRKVSLDEKLKRESFSKAGKPLANKTNVKFLASV
ncbi:phosphatidylserine decarboxylase [Halobacillus sp. A1]|uniref:phosphatidylserine decarboxylase n=1 Tax=Halobacillus sp. A1 TaxID=2880262 RepID=UPI003531A0E1|nr:phosphatidylserine decarboxylase [Halobacillus sp. A1]